MEVRERSKRVEREKGSFFLVFFFMRAKRGKPLPLRGGGYPESWIRGSMEERVIGEGPKVKREARERSSDTLWAPFFPIHWPQPPQPSLSPCLCFCYFRAEVWAAITVIGRSSKMAGSPLLSVWLLGRTVRRQPTGSATWRCLFGKKSNIGALTLPVESWRVCFHSVSHLFFLFYFFIT